MRLPFILGLLGVLVLTALVCLFFGRVSSRPVVIHPSPLTTASPPARSSSPTAPGPVPVPVGGETKGPELAPPLEATTPPLSSPGQAASDPEVPSGPVQQNIVEARWTAFWNVATRKYPGDPDSDEGRSRRALAERQLDLPARHVRALLDGWAQLGSPEFLPLVRREAGTPSNDLVALIAWAGLEPAVAGPQVADELRKPDSRLLTQKYPAAELLPTIEPMALPEFDNQFRALLPSAQKDPSPVIPLIGCFGSTALLPDVIQAYRSFAHDPVHPWSPDVLHALFLYWMRGDPTQAATALVEEIRRQDTDGSAVLITITANPWHSFFKPVVTACLEDSHPRTVVEAIFLLEKHGDAGSLDGILTALERLKHSSEVTGFSETQARQLLDGSGWPLSAAQRARLQALTAAAP